MGKALSYVRNSRLIHSRNCFLSISDQNGLFDALIDNQRVSDNNIVNLEKCQVVASVQSRAFTSKTLREVSKHSSGSCAVVSIRLF